MNMAGMSPTSFAAGASPATASPLGASATSLPTQAQPGFSQFSQMPQTGQPGGGDFLGQMMQMMGMMMSMVMLMMQTVLSQLTANKGMPGGTGGLSNPATASALASASPGGTSSTGGSPATGSGANTAAGKNGVITTNASATKPAGQGNGKANVLIEGDSLSTFTGGGYSYADQISKKLGGSANFTQLAKGGDMVAGGISKDAAANANKFDPNAKDNVVVLWGGTNDLFSDRSAKETYDKLAKTAQTYKDKGFKVVVLTSVQFGGPKNSAKQDQERRSYNDLIRANNGPWDSVVDVASLPQFSDKDDSVTNNHSIYAGDGVHLTQQGYGLISDQVQQALKAMGIG